LEKNVRSIHTLKKDRKIPKVTILVSTANDWGRRLIKGILSYANEVGPWHIWVREDTPQLVKELPQSARGDGIIARVATQSLARELQESGIPVVNVADSPIEDFSAPCVRTDDRIGTRMVVQHFADRGIRNLAFAGPSDRANPIWYSKAFQSEAKAKGLTCSVFSSSESTRDEKTRLDEWLHSLPKPVGLLSWGHGLAREVVDRCLETNISVPHDIAVMCGGYDELLSRACFPAVSGVLSPTDQIGYKAAQFLHQMMQGEEVPRETTYIPPCGIIEHLSTDTLAVNNPKLLQIIQYLQNNALKPITMADILEVFPMARRSLERQFQQAFGRTVVDEIRRIRVNKARSLLTDTNLAMQDIAEACGYATYNYLTHVFKRTTGITPSEYRRQFRPR